MNSFCGILCVAVWSPDSCETRIGGQAKKRLDHFRSGACCISSSGSDCRYHDLLSHAIVAGVQSIRRTLLPVAFLTSDRYRYASPRNQAARNSGRLWVPVFVAFMMLASIMPISTRTTCRSTPTIRLRCWILIAGLSLRPVRGSKKIWRVCTARCKNSYDWTRACTVRVRTGGSCCRAISRVPDRRSSSAKALADP